VRNVEARLGFELMRAMSVACLNASKVLLGVCWVTLSNAFIFGATRAWRRWRGGARAESGANFAIAEVAVDHIRVAVILLDFVIGALGLVAPATRGTVLASRDRIWVGCIKPDHANLVVIPQRKDECHLMALALLAKSTMPCQTTSARCR